MENLKDISKFIDDAHPIGILLVGAGGTGSQVLTHLGRIHASLILAGRAGLQVTMIDDDIVTESNMGRQLFSKVDIGKYKAQVLIERVNRFFGCLWHFDTARLKSTYSNSGSGYSIMISCVDTAKSRIDLKAAVGNMYSYNGGIRYWIDCGNGKNTGQIVVGCKDLGLPDIIDLVPDLANHETESDTPSCSLIEALEKQDLFINTMVAAFTGDIIWNIIFHKTLNVAQLYINLKNRLRVTAVSPEQYYEIQNRKVTERINSGQNTNESSQGASGSTTRKVRSGNKPGKRSVDPNEEVLLFDGN